MGRFTIIFQGFKIMILDSIYNEGKLQEIYKNVLTNMRCGVIIMTSKEKRENKTKK